MLGTVQGLLANLEVEEVVSEGGLAGVREGVLEEGLLGAPGVTRQAAGDTESCHLSTFLKAAAEVEFHALSCLNLSSCAVF